MFANIKSDLARYRDNVPGRGKLKNLILCLLEQGFIATMGYRTCAWLIRKRIPIIHIFIQKLVEITTGISIPPSVKIGKGFVVEHFGGIVINAGTQFGKNCTITHGVTMGNKIPGGGAPVIGDDVYICVDAKVLGDITVGHHSIIGAGSILMESVPPYSIVAGSPAKVVKTIDDVNQYGAFFSKPRKKQIAILIDNLDVGGTQRQLIEYLKHANREEFDLHLINLEANRRDLASEIEALDIPIHNINHSGLINIKTIISVTRILKKIEPDIVQTYLFTADTYGRIAATFAGVPKIICSIRGMDPWKKSHHLLIDRLLLKVTNVVTVNAANIIPHLENVWQTKKLPVETIYNGIDLKRFEAFRPAEDVRAEFNIPNDATLIGMVGRYTFEKDHESMIESMAQLREQNIDIYFLAMGYGNKHAKLQQMITKHGLEGRFILTGQRTDAPDLINAMDICVLASHSEGCPNVILEYMAAHKPVIASDVGGCAELVVHEETGFIVPDADVDQFTVQFKKLINDVALRSEMGEKGKIKLDQEFTTDILIEKTEALYNRLLTEA